MRWSLRSRSPHGERGLKFDLDSLPFEDGGRRSPHGERGLKCKKVYEVIVFACVALLTESVD